MASYPPKRATAYEAKWPMFSVTTGAFLTGLTVTTTVSKDGGTFAATTNSASEIATSSGSYKLTLTATEMTADEVEVHATATGARDTSVIVETSIRQIDDVLYSGQANSITAAMLAADIDVYTAFVWMTKDGTTSNRYSIIWFKNGAPVTSGTSAQLLTVTNEANTVLVNGVTPTEVGTSEWFIWDEGTNKITTGVNYMVKVSATIDGSTRTWETPLITRDA